MRARMVAAGELGKLRVVQVEYAQDWLTEPLETHGPEAGGVAHRSGARARAAALGDIGTHAYHLACFVSGLTLDELCADLTTFVPGRRLDDDVQVLLRFEGGARGMLWAQPGRARQRERAAPPHLWHQGRPRMAAGTSQSSLVHPFGQPRADHLSRRRQRHADAARVTRMPSGHPEGYLEGFATLYGEIAQAIRAARQGGTPSADVVFPTIDDGIHGMAFIEAAVRSSAGSGSWVDLP